jgi:hypothetical protein
MRAKCRVVVDELAGGLQAAAGAADDIVEESHV